MSAISANPCPNVTVEGDVIILATNQNSPIADMKFECSKPYQYLEGPDHIRCTPDGTWSDSPPTCKGTFRSNPISFSRELYSQNFFLTNFSLKLYSLTLFLANSAPLYCFRQLHSEKIIRNFFFSLISLENSRHLYSRYCPSSSFPQTVARVSPRSRTAISCRIARTRTASTRKARTSNSPATPTTPWSALAR